MQSPQAPSDTDSAASQPTVSRGRLRFGALDRRHVLRNVAPALLGFGLFCLGIWALYGLVGPMHPDQVFADLRATPLTSIVLAICATILAYVALIGYDWMALQYLDKTLPKRAVFVGGFLGYAFGNTIGLSALSGGAVRYRIYSAYGLNGYEVAGVATYVSVALGVGAFIIGLYALAFNPALLAEMLHLNSALLGPLAGLWATGLVIMIVGLSWSRLSMRIGPMTLVAPTPRLLLGQALVSLADICMAALVLFLLMPDSTPPFFAFLAIYAAALLAGVISHVPGGVGVFEAVMIAAMPAGTPLPQVASALVLYRLIYFILPFVLAFVLVTLNEVMSASGATSRFLGRIIGPPLEPVSRAVRAIAPASAGVATLGLGAYLILMAVLPAVRPHDIQQDDFWITLILEGGATLSALAGLGLILIAQGLFRRIAAAYWLTQLGLGIGVIASVLNGFDWDSALLLAAGMGLIYPLRAQFFRGARLTHDMLSPAWFVVALGIAVSAMAVLFLVHEQTPYSNDLWFRFSGRDVTPRALRATMIAAVGLMIVMAYVALQPVRARTTAPTPEAIDKARQILRQSRCPGANLALTGDKQLFFSENEDAFIMYAIQGRSWIAYGDPIGPRCAIRDLAWAFFDSAYAASARPVFYEVSEDYLALWIEMGLTLHKIGEEAVIDLTDWSLGGKKFKTMRAAHNQAQREGLEFDILQAPHAPALIDRLRVVSDAWLSDKRTREKGFSVGRFDPDYLNNGPIAVARRDGDIVAFANILVTDELACVGIDLMRFMPEHARGMMEFLFINLAETFRDQGYAQFSLGMAPLSGLDGNIGNKIWNRFGAVLFRHGATFYNFAGLRGFKQKFAPQWKPRFLAVPGVLPPFIALKDAAILIAGGAKGLINK